VSLFARLRKLMLDPWGCTPCPDCGGTGEIRTDLFRKPISCFPCAGSGVVAYKWSAAVLEGAEFEGES
jgi:DnaJ-class molecular chaperone